MTLYELPMPATFTAETSPTTTARMRILWKSQGAPRISKILTTGQLFSNGYEAGDAGNSLSNGPNIPLLRYLTGMKAIETLSSQATNTSGNSPGETWSQWVRPTKTSWHAGPQGRGKSRFSSAQVRPEQRRSSSP